MKHGNQVLDSTYYFHEDFQTFILISAFCIFYCHKLSRHWLIRTAQRVKLNILDITSADSRCVQQIGCTWLHLISTPWVHNTHQLNTFTWIGLLKVSGPPTDRVRLDSKVYFQCRAHKVNPFRHSMSTKDSYNNCLLVGIRGQDVLRIKHKLCSDTHSCA